MKNKIIAFDLDDTLCSRPNDVEHLGGDKYQHCYPIQKNIDILNKLASEGNTIYIYTARGMSTFNGNVDKIYENLYELTLTHLKEWGVNHHGLYMGKIHYDLLVDDKVIHVDDIDCLISSIEDNE
tara:strand:+ start:16051 stop:16425 length:375 start_codon:yes stop_codon:yes gene_type:complete